MRFLTRLVLSHTLIALVLSVALGVALAALLRIGVVLTTLREKELAVLHDEGHLHSATWELDREIRHATLACARGAASAEVNQKLAPRALALEQELASAAHVSRLLRDVVAEFVAMVQQIPAGEGCVTLLSADVQQRRSELDERLTDFWVARLEELHRAVEDKDSDAQRMAISAAWAGIPLALFAFIFALWMARLLARLLEEPLRSLAETARRVGSGDFATPVSIDGPPEISALASELERMRAQLLELESLKQSFLASVSHELRTPLSKIREALSLLQDGAVGKLDERQARVVHIAQSACEREIRMVTTLLDLSRLRAGSPIRLSQGSLDGAIDAALDDERIEAQQRGVAIDFEREGEVPPGNLDPELFERAIANVVRNAVSVSRRGQRVVVRRTVDPSPGPGQVVRITVADQGPGVPDDIRERLFDPFITRSIPKAGRSVGVGLGLPLAREVARAHGGELELVASTEHGTTFQFVLPRSSEAAAYVQEPEGRKSLESQP